MYQLFKWEAKPLGRSNFLFTLLGTFSITRYPPLRNTVSCCLHALYCTYILLRQLKYLYSSRFKHLLPPFWTTSFRKYKRQTHFQDFFSGSKKNRWSFSPKYAIGIWPDVKTCPNHRRTEQLQGQGAGHKLPKPRRLCKSDSLRSENSSEENKRQVY